MTSLWYTGEQSVYIMDMRLILETPDYGLRPRSASAELAEHRFRSLTNSCFIARGKTMRIFGHKTSQTGVEYLSRFWFAINLNSSSCFIARGKTMRILGHQKGFVYLFIQSKYESIVLQG